MSTPWIHVATLTATGSITLEGDELRHLAARRIREGDPLVVFDARGTVGEARLIAARRRSAELSVESLRQLELPADPFVIASAIPKGERLSAMLQMLTQLGVPRWQPLVLEESAVRKLDVESRRLERILIEGCKVARRPFALAVESPCRLEALLEHCRDAGAGSICFGDRGGEPAAALRRARLLVIGPEAGFTSGERARLEASGARAVAFAPYNLRIETAVVAGAACYQAMKVALQTPSPSAAGAVSAGARA